MKKYTIKDKSGTKKTIYAKDLSHALTFVDSKAGGFDYPDNENEADITWNNGLYIGKKAGYNRYAVSKKIGSKYLVWGVYSPKELDKLHLTEDSIKDDVVSNYFYFDLDDLSMSLDNAVNIMKNCGLTIVKIDKSSKEAKVYYKGTSAAEQKAVDKLDISLDDSINDSVKDDYLGMVKINGRTWYVIHKKSIGMPEFWGITPDKWGDNPKKKFKSKAELDKYLKSVGATDSIKDEANLPTTIQALVDDEEAAIKAYEVAIKNLEGKIDETAKQVLINIMKDERRHVENLYAILNGQVTEKNLEDSIHDSTTSDLFKAIDKLYAKYGDLDVLSNTDLDNAIKELATTLPNVRYDEFKDVVENFIGERRLRERMKRSGLTYFKR